MNKTLVVDIGGTHVKLMVEGAEQRMFDSGPQMRPADFVGQVKEKSRGWNFDNVSIGFPSPVRGGQITKEPKHLGQGWVGFDFGKSLGKPVQAINDAAMQALGSYHGGRMLFLGLGTGLGSAFALENRLFPLELGDLPYRDRDIIENFLGIPGIERLGEEEWKQEVIFAVTQLKKSFIADYVVLGGGNVHRFAELPEGIERGKNENAFIGGVRLWETEAGQDTAKWQIF
ncbi:MAG TPA: ROK family protein [Chthoniobacterales bacterium]|nr:ROK family protein [Chthoniobacterales bacterium]